MVVVVVKYNARVCFSIVAGDGGTRLDVSSQKCWWQPIGRFVPKCWWHPIGRFVPNKLVAANWTFRPTVLVAPDWTFRPTVLVAPDWTFRPTSVGGTRLDVSSHDLPPAVSPQNRCANVVWRCTVGRNAALVVVLGRSRSRVRVGVLERDQTFR